MSHREPGKSTPQPAGTIQKFIRNATSNAAGIVITAMIAFLMPPFLVHRLDPATYSAWVLILNLGAYVGYLDFGVQTAVSKFVAEHDAKGDHEMCGRFASTGVAMMLGAMVLGILMTAGMAIAVPTLFHKMPVALYHDVRWGIVFVGVSLSVGLVGSPFQAIFLGLQRYKVPASMAVISRSLYAVVLVGSVLLHSRLAVMGAAIAAVNLITVAMQIIMGTRLASHVPVRIFPVDFDRLQRMVRYCIVLTFWSVCMLFVSGLDLTIVGHYAFREAAAYAIASTPTNFMLLIFGALMGPLLPAASALSTKRTAQQMGDILLRTTRYASLLLYLISLPLALGAFVLLRWWVGPTYAMAATPLLRVLVVANVLRQLCAPYSTMVVATARQRVATVAAGTEGLVNLIASIFLAKKMGAMGVAYGTLIGSVTSVAAHFLISMHYTKNLDVTRARLFLLGLVRPAAMILPTLALVPFWLHDRSPAMRPTLWIGWVVSTLLLAFWVSLTSPDREFLQDGIKSRGGQGFPLQF